MDLKSKVKEILGTKYSPIIANYLNDKGITNTLSEPYHFSSIQAVVNGTRNNLEMEKAIIELLEITIKKKEKTAKKLEKLNS
jgi:hypothetical protein